MKSYGDYLASIFPHFKVQKLSVDAGFTCPNRDGSIGFGGCIYCRNDSFTPSYCKAADTIEEQLEKGKKFFAKKYPDMKYLAYFQSYTATYKEDFRSLEALYRKALDVTDIIGLVIATRPDCIKNEILTVLSEINTSYPVFIELGVESSHDSTLRLINRNHTWADVVEAAERIKDMGLHLGVHLIAGLPYESEEMIIQTIRKVVELPIETIKLHQLQVLKDTPLFHKIENKEIEIQNYSLEEYLNLCAKIVKIVPSDIIIERFLSQSPPELVISPSWGWKNYEFMNKLAKLL